MMPRSDLRSECATSERAPRSLTQVTLAGLGLMAGLTLHPSLAMARSLTPAPVIAVEVLAQPGNPPSILDLHHVIVAQTDPSTPLGDLEIESENNAIFIPPPDAGTPTSTGGTGSRGDESCGATPDSAPLASLVGQSPLTLTTSDRPVIWIYVPDQPADAPSGTLVVQQGMDEIYQGDFALAATPGIVGISLPPEAPALDIGAEYDWFVYINCAVTVDGVTVNDFPVTLDGKMQRVAVSDALAADLEAALPGLETVVAYGQHHIWYDLLTELARSRLEGESHADLDEVWTQLLSDPAITQLREWAQEPLVEEVTPSDETAAVLSQARVLEE